MKQLLNMMILALLAVVLMQADRSSAKDEATPPAGARITPDGWFAPIMPKRPKPALPKEVTKCYVIPIREEIKEKTYDAMKRKVLRARAGGAQLIVLDMDTWGGDLHAALDISRILKADAEGIFTVCYVRTRAVSAGALIAIACNEIVMSPTGAFGDCAPIMLGGQLTGIEREKIETVVRTEFDESAELNGYNAALAEAMVTAGREVWLVRNKETRELRYVLSRDFRGQVEIPPGLASAPSNPKGKWELLKMIDAEGELLTMDPSRAVEYGFASAIIKPGLTDALGPLMEHYNVTVPPTVLSDTWSEVLVGFLTSVEVTAILLFVGLLCVYMEMHTPGFGVAAVGAIVCFAILFGSRYLVGMAAWWEIVMFVVGFVLIILEIFVIPGFGVAGILGIIFCVVGLLAMLVANAPDKLPIPETDLDWAAFARGVLAIGLAVVASIVVGAFIARWLPKVPVASRLVLAAPAAPGTLPASAGSPLAEIKPGDVGVVAAICRPAGLVRFGDNLIDAVADGAFIPAGTTVKVIKIEGNRIVVQPVT